MGAGTYVVAVSGGVDSMVLLDLLRQRPGMKLIVAHYDHGIRRDSADDRKLVQQIAKKHGLTFVHAAGKLGPEASEATARKARYEFLNSVRKAANARAIITAHHQDDMIETAIFNLLRGSGRKGLAALKSTEGIVRPLLGYEKERIKEYAIAHGLHWHEDPTNIDTKYVRNYIRHNILTKFSAGQRAELLILLERIAELNKELDEHLTGLLHIQPATNELDKKWFIELPHKVAAEVIHTWLRRHNAKKITKKTIEKLIVAMKTAKKDTILDVDSKLKLVIGHKSLKLVQK